MRAPKYLRHRGMTLTLAQWAQNLGMSKETLVARLRYGWTVDEALTTPPRPRASAAWPFPAPSRVAGCPKEP